jgi:hypothetical protein
MDLKEKGGVGLIVAYGRSGDVAEARLRNGGRYWYNFRKTSDIAEAHSNEGRRESDCRDQKLLNVGR